MTLTAAELFEIDHKRKQRTEALEKQQDVVNHPQHYVSGGIECIEAIKASMSAEEFAGYLKGNTVKYLWRYRLKGKAQEDLQKADWYLKRLLTENQGEK